MKLLAADIGNTNLTLGLFDEGELLGSWRATTDTTATDDEIAVLVDQLLGLDGHALAEVDAVAIASVVPPLTTTFARMIRARTDGMVRIVGPMSKRNPASLSTAALPPSHAHFSKTTTR